VTVPFRRHLALIAGIAVAVVPAAACSEGGTGVPDSPTAVEIAASDGRATTLDSFEGTPLVVNLWATWCKPCVREMPDFDSVADSSQGVRIVGVNVGDDPADAAAFATALGVSYEQFTDAQGALSDAFEVSGLPSTVFIAADGTVLEVTQGALSETSLRAKITSHFPEAVMEDEA
jgi:thiol-disulfide isomerase/thioredoxin